MWSLLSYDVNYSFWLSNCRVRESPGICQQFMQHRIKLYLFRRCIDVTSIIFANVLLAHRQCENKRARVRERESEKTKKVERGKERTSEGKSVNILNKWHGLNELGRQRSQTSKPTELLHIQIIAQYIMADRVVVAVVAYSYAISLWQKCRNAIHSVIQKSDGEIVIKPLSWCFRDVTDINAQVDKHEIKKWKVGLRAVNSNAISILPKCAPFDYTSYI